LLSFSLFTVIFFSLFCRSCRVFSGRASFTMGMWDDMQGVVASVVSWFALLCSALVGAADADVSS
jgi:hypothetical protein